ncbi:toxin-activating lysine-acyltransferase [uncultured Tateyamaria sp.]|uniref:toxin-activating lysine-acyltransferase n=1 Tax=uncultured Tateyamaria sp. TaxID=455651 RepID=UPI00260190BE|nr:toxin-activating lysine-acyltransferase [uncultured Tateyamaria sp.]
MVTVDYYAGVGYALELLARSEYHRQFQLGRYLRVEVLPALHSSQSRFYLNGDSIPVGMVTWAWLSPQVEAEIHQTGRALAQPEWNCGDRLFFNDWITPYQNMREVLHDMTYVVFPDKVATSLRRNQDRSVRRINKWTGIELRRARERVVV